MGCSQWEGKQDVLPCGAPSGPKTPSFRARAPDGNHFSLWSNLGSQSGWQLHRCNGYSQCVSVNQNCMFKRVPKAVAGLMIALHQNCSCRLANTSNVQADPGSRSRPYFHSSCRDVEQQVLWSSCFPDKTLPVSQPK